MGGGELLKKVEEYGIIIKKTTGIDLWKVNDIKNYMSIIKLFSAKNRFLV